MAGYLSSKKEQEKKDRRKKTVVYSSAKIEEILKSMNSGYEPDMTPFFENDINFRDANVPFEMTDWEKEEWLKCSVDAEYFISTYVKFQTDHGYKNVVLREYQKNFVHLLCDEVYDEEYDEFVPENQSIVGLMSRQLGKTTSTCGSFAWYMLFHNERNLFITANKGQTTSEIVNKLTEMVARLPYFLKPGIVKKNQHSLKFDNGCYLYSAPASKSPATGFTIHFMYIDEAALIPSNIIDDYWKSVYPTLSSSKISKIVLTSTPRGRQNLFYRLYDGGLNRRNSFKTIRADWWENPDHDEEWERKTKADFGEEEFAQEFELQWDVAASKLVRGTDSQFMNRIRQTFKTVDISDIPVELCNCFLWHPNFDPTSQDNYKKHFVIIGDTAEGKELQISGKNKSDYNVLQIFEMELMPAHRILKNALDKNISITDCFRFRQVGVYADNLHDMEQMGKACRYLIYNTWKNGIGKIDNTRILIEMNFNGKNFLKQIMDSDYWYEELVFKTHHTQPVPGKYTKREFGFKTTAGGKGIGKSYFCEEGAKMITQRRTIISQYHKDDNLCTIAELNAFDKIRKTNNSDYFVYGGVGLHDDLAYSVLNCSRVVEIPEYRDWMDEYFNNYLDPQNRNWKKVAEILKKAVQKDDEGMSDNDFSTIYTNGIPTQGNNFAINNKHFNLGEGMLSKRPSVNPYLNKTIQNPYLQKKVTNPYLQKNR